MGNPPRINRKKKRETKTLSWELVPSDVIGDSVLQLTNRGYGCMFAVTRGSKALSFTVYADGDKETLYINSGDGATETFLDFIQDIIEVDTTSS